MRNILKYHLNYTFWVAVSTLTSGTVLQTFLMENGFSENTTNVVISIFQIVNIVVMMLCSRLADRVKNVIRAYAGLFLLYIPMVIMLAVISFSSGITTVLAILLFVGMALYSTGSGLNCSMAYKLPYVIFDISQYGRVCSVAGILTGIFGVAVSLLLTWLQGTLGYSTAMKVMFLLCIPLTLAASASVMCMKPIA